MFTNTAFFHSERTLILKQINFWWLTTSSKFRFRTKSLQTLPLHFVFYNVRLDLYRNFIKRSFSSWKRICSFGRTIFHIADVEIIITRSRQEESGLWRFTCFHVIKPHSRTLVLMRINPAIAHTFILCFGWSLLYPLLESLVFNHFILFKTHNPHLFNSFRNRCFLEFCLLFIIL